MTRTYTSSKINPGIYLVTFANGARVRVVLNERGFWNTYLVSCLEYGRDSWMQTYCTKGDAIADLVTCVDELV
jgi:hypothetical protein